MQRVIDIPEETFKYYVTLANKRGEQISNLERIILDSTLLPEGHGRLIDADRVIAEMNEMKVGGEVFTTAVNYVKLIMKDTPTIIEASSKQSMEGEWTVVEASPNQSMGMCK